MPESLFELGHSIKDSLNLTFSNGLPGPAMTPYVSALTQFSTEDRALLERVKQTVREVEPTASIILYGSRARGDAAPDSDWDLLLLLDDTVDCHREDALLHRVYGVEFSEERCPVLSTFVESRREWDTPRNRATPFRQNVDRECISL